MILRQRVCNVEEGLFICQVEHCMNCIDMRAVRWWNLGRTARHRENKMQYL